MSAKILIAFVLVFFICLVPSASSADIDCKAIGEAFEGLKKGLENLLKQIQEDPLFQKINEIFQQLGEALEAQGKQLADTAKRSKPKN